MPIFDRFRALPGKVRDKAEDAASRAQDAASRALDRFRTPEPRPPTPVLKPTIAPGVAPVPHGALAVRPEGWPRDGWDERGWIHYNVGDRVEFSSADNSGVVHAISSQKPQNDKQPYKEPPEAVMQDGTVGVVVGLRQAQDPIVLVEGAAKAFGYRRQDVINLTLEKDRRWGQRVPRGEGRSSMVHPGMALTTRIAAAREDLVEWILSDLTVLPLGSGPQGEGWLVYAEKPYLGRIYLEDPARAALTWVDEHWETDTSEPLTPREIRYISQQGRTWMLQQGTPYGASPLAEAASALMVAASRAGRLLFIEDAAKQAWTGAASSSAPVRAPVVAARRVSPELVTKRVVVADPEGVFAAARPSFNGAELTPMARKACVEAAHVAEVEDVFVVERRRGEAVLDVRGPRALTPQSLAARLFD